MIEKERIETIKTQTDIIALIESYGIPLKKNGKGYVGLCPFHDDKTPSLSITPSTNLWQCFGCGLGGDVIRFVELIDKRSFPDAVNQLSGTIPPLLNRPPVSTDDTHAPLSVKEKKLLSRVVDYYQHTLTRDVTGIDYLNRRGITDKRSIADFGTGYVNGTLLDILPDDREITDSLKHIGILNTKGNEVFYGCVVFPLLNQGSSVVSLYGRSVNETIKVKHRYLKGPRSGLVNQKAVKRSGTVILTESVIDALTLYDRGFKNVIPLYGVNGLTPDHLFILNRNIKKAYLAFDADEAGRACADKTKEQLKEKNISAYRIDLPVKDVNEFFISHTTEAFETLLKKAHPESVERSDTAVKREQAHYQQTEGGFTVCYGIRSYQIKGIQKSATQLKITVKASPVTVGSAIGKRPFELTTIDLYSSRSRAWFVKVIAELFAEPEDLIKEDVARLLALAEDYRKSEHKETADESTPEEIEAAMKFLNTPGMFEEILADLEITGIIGEETNKLVGYLAAISRKLDDPLSVLVQSRSAAGKSTLQDAVLSLVPPEDYVKYTRITDQALFYKDEDSLKHKILAIEEEVGMGGAAYSIRNIQTSKKITVAATGKDPATGKMRTEEYTVNGPIAVMITTTSADLEGETASRFLFVTIDESSEMTEAIHKKQREADTLDGLINKTKSEAIIKKHHAAQRLLKPVAVVNPYSPYLRYPSGSLRTRRDHKKYLGLIKATCCLHQFQRKAKTVTVDGQTVDYIEVTLDDIDKANRLANQVLGQCLDDLARPSRTLLKQIIAMVRDMEGDSNENDFFFNRRMIREYTGWTDWQIRAHIRQLEELEYLYARMGSRGKEYAYALNYTGKGEDEERFYLNLTPVKEIERLMRLRNATPPHVKQDKKKAVKRK